MNFKQFFGGVLVGVVFGMLIGAALVEGIDSDIIKRAGVGAILAFAGVLIVRQGSSK
jgi:hypothetical protein